ncbi:MAG: S-adenosylmethionine:tRNA ribosyltransferase-isomerase [Candidatus Latescibacteria bacterium]|nr:S-adenosylmethionine:tRNA ribosyltransferase-isomerase [Candidatus Latescibacterota bacterium]
MILPATTPLVPPPRFAEPIAETSAPFALPEPVVQAPASLDFVLPAILEAGEPPEARGLARDQVRLLVTGQGGASLEHAQFRQLPDFLQPGDAVVINTSGTLNAALPAQRADGTELQVHLSTRLPANLWIVELRRPYNGTTQPFSRGRTGEILTLPEGGRLTLHTPHNAELRGDGKNPVRLWIASLATSTPLDNYLAAQGSPIRYQYVRDAWPLDYYQTVYATENGSAEMPSAGRAFTPEIITRLVARGVQVVPLVLHTGVASLEDHEPPYEEYYNVPASTAEQLQHTHRQGGRIIAVGTTVVRALETVTTPEGRIHPGSGWTRLVITPDRPMRAVDALITGLHEPQATHLAMLTALAGQDHIRTAYQAALAGQYLWHEFGDLHLILP